MSSSIKIFAGLATVAAGWYGASRYSEPTTLHGLQVKLETYPKQDRCLEEKPCGPYLEPRLRNYPKAISNIPPLKLLETVDCSSLHSVLLPSFGWKKCEERKMAFARLILKGYQEKPSIRSSEITATDAPKKIAENLQNLHEVNEYQQFLKCNSYNLVRGAHQHSNKTQSMKKSLEVFQDYRDFENEVSVALDHQIATFLHFQEGTPEQLVSAIKTLDEERKSKLVKELSTMKEDLKKTDYRRPYFWD